MQKTIIIIPCYNESDRININTYKEFLKNNPSINLFFIDDGSTDNTFNLLSELSKLYSNAIAYQLQSNVGKAEAIRQAVKNLYNNYEFDQFGYFDADLSTSLEYILKFQSLINNSKGTRIVIGSRIKRLGSTISRSPIRHFFGRIVATIASNILSLPVYDTQCGAKLFEKEFAQNIFNEPFKTKWLFDIELFARLNLQYDKKIVFSSILEYPLEQWIDEGNSRIKIKDFIKVPIDLIKIALKYRS